MTNFSTKRTKTKQILRKKIENYSVTRQAKRWGKLVAMPVVFIKVKV